MNLIQYLQNKKLITPPKWLPTNVHYLCQMGSVAYGVSSDNSDVDIYGFCIPEKTEVFPHLRGEILGFGRQKQRFQQYQQHHVFDESANGGHGCEYDMSVYGIVKFFTLCMENNPNMVDALFVPERCIRHITKIGQMVRDSRHIFLHKGCWHKFRGYAKSQMHKMRIKTPKEGKRKKLVEEFGYDIKFAYHIVRLMDEVEQILEGGELDLERSRETLKEIRRGEWEEQRIYDYFAHKETHLEKLYYESKLPHKPQEGKIKALLLQCLETHFGSLEKCVVDEGILITTLRDMRDKLNSIKLD